MKRQKKGTIAAVSSIADVRGFQNSAAYCASKSAATKLLESARSELSSLGINIITIRPGFIRTAMTAKNKFYMPLLMDVDKAVKIITRGIDRGKKIIAFPRRMVFLTWIARSVPDTVYEAFVGFFNRKVFRDSMVGM
jgi:short-subunit dehydrogenase